MNWKPPERIASPRTNRCRSLLGLHPGATAEAMKPLATLVPQSAGRDALLRVRDFSPNVPMPAARRTALGTAGVPACELRGVRAPAGGTGGETPPELAGADACGTGSPRSADFQVCCIAGFQTRRRSAHPQRLGLPHAPETPWPLPIWKSATQQVGKPALPGQCGYSDGAGGGKRQRSGGNETGVAAF